MPALLPLLALACVALAADLHLPSTYSCNARFWVPSPENVQNMRISFDEGTVRELVAFYNATGDMIDYTIINGEHQYIVETWGHDLACTKVAAPQGQSLQELQYLLPDPEEDWRYIGRDRLSGRAVEHYRLNGEYASPDEHSTSNTVREFQQDYYCYMQDGLCLPVRWEIWGISMFGSHFDHYVLDYSNVQTSVADSDFFEPDLCVDVPEPEPEPGPDPGPTARSNVAGLLGSFANSRARNSRSFARFAARYGKNYTTEEIPARRELLARRARMIERHNAQKGRSFTMGMNRFGDMTLEEVKRSFTGFRPAKVRSSGIQTWSFSGSISDLPTQLDWRARYGYIKAKDQVACGSCWTFGAIGTIEPRINIARFRRGETDTPYVRFSEQALVDCFWGHGSFGCSGGDTFDVIDWLVREKGGLLALEDEYPYLGQNDWCKDELFGKDARYRVTGVKLVKPNSIASLKAALQDGPISVTIGVTDSFLFYQSGIYYDRACPGQDYNDLAHAVVAVGYGVDRQFGEYLIVRNSWSEYWGMDGYIYISLNADNICGILTYPGFAEVQVS